MHKPYKRSEKKHIHTDIFKQFVIIYSVINKMGMRQTADLSSQSYREHYCFKLKKCRRRRRCRCCIRCCRCCRRKCARSLLLVFNCHSLTVTLPLSCCFIVFMGQIWTIATQILSMVLNCKQMARAELEQL